MARVRRKDKKLQESVSEPKGFDIGYILEESQQATTNGHQAYNFLSGIRNVDSNYLNNDLLIEKMVADPVIASALDIWTEDALQRDILSGEIFNVEVESPDDSPVEQKLAERTSEKIK